MTKYHKKIKPPKAFLLLTFLFIGFGLGYTTKEFIEPSTNLIAQQTAEPQLLEKAAVSVCFSPNKQCQMNILREISKATKKLGLFKQILF